MNQKKAVGDNWLLIGNLLTIMGGCCIGVGTVMKLAAGSGLPSGKAVFSNPGGSADNLSPLNPNTRDAARDYFSI